MFNGGPYEKEFTAIHNFFKDSYGFTFFDDFNTIASDFKYLESDWGGYYYFNFTIAGNRYCIEFGGSKSHVMDCRFNMKRKRNPYVGLNFSWYSKGIDQVDTAVIRLYNSFVRYVREIDIMLKINKAVNP
jgi:hypothetical protein